MEFFFLHEALKGDHLLLYLCLLLIILLSLARVMPYFRISFEKKRSLEPLIIVDNWNFRQSNKKKQKQKTGQQQQQQQQQQQNKTAN